MESKKKKILKNKINCNSFNKEPNKKKDNIMNWINNISILFICFIIFMKYKKDAEKRIEKEKMKGE